MEKTKKTSLTRKKEEAVGASEVKEIEGELDGNEQLAWETSIIKLKESMFMTAFLTQ